MLRTRQNSTVYWGSSHQPPCEPTVKPSRKRKRSSGNNDDSGDEQDDNERDDDNIEDGGQPDLSSMVRNKFGSLFGHRMDSGNDKGQINHIYFDETINKHSARKLIGQIEELNIKLGKMCCEYDLPEQPKIYLHLNSPGGCLLSAFGIIDCIRRSKFKITSIVESACASAITLISVSASERLISKHAYMLIHQLSSACWGKMAEIDDEYANLKDLMERIYEIYEQHTKLKRKQLQKILKGDRWWRAEQCLKYGLVDRIV